MKRFIIIYLLLSFNINGLCAQKELSKKEIRKQRKIELLEASLNMPKLRFGAKNMLSPTGENLSARGGILYLNGNRGEFMEFLTFDTNGKIKIISLDFDLENYTVRSSFKDSDMKISFSGFIKGEKWKFNLVVKQSGKSNMQIIKRKGITINYDGRISKF